MKKIILAVPFLLLAQGTPPMPPMPPMMAMPVQKQPTKKPQKRPNTAVKHSLPKECKVVPPMLIFMPPPLENDLRKCKNILFKPSKEAVFKNLKIKALKIEPVNGFSGLYKIVSKNKTIYCNKYLNKCFEVKKWIKK